MTPWVAAVSATWARCCCAGSRSAPINPDPLTLRTSGEDSTDLRALLGRGDRWHLMSFGAAAASTGRRT